MEQFLKPLENNIVKRCGSISSLIGVLTDETQQQDQEMKELRKENLILTQKLLEKDEKIKNLEKKLKENEKNTKKLEEHCKRVEKEMLDTKYKIAETLNYAFELDSLEIINFIEKTIISFEIYILSLSIFFLTKNLLKIL